MPELSELAALEYAIERRLQRKSDALRHVYQRSPRTARLLLNSGNPEAWASLQADEPPQTNSSTFDLLSTAIRSEVTWLASGRRVADPATIEKRLAACQQCSFKREAPASAAYYLGRAVMRPSDTSVCGACGCYISAKVRRLNENCPITSDMDSTLSKWGEQIANSERT